MDFYTVAERSTKRGTIEVFPDFKIGKSSDLMIRSKAFYAVWDAKAGMWSTDEYDVQRLVDEHLLEHKEKLASRTDNHVTAQLLSSFTSKSWREYRAYLGLAPDNYKQLDNKLTFSNTEVGKKDHVSRRLPYPLEEGECPAFDEIMSVLYNPEERAKIEWAIGSIVSGEAKNIQKFCVLYGAPGAGKGTVLDIIKKLFEGYYTTFEAKALTSASNAFAAEMFRGNPLVAIQSDGDLSRIEDNTKLNSIISHEEIVINEKFKPAYSSRINSFLFLASNKPVKITDGKSGIIRRLIDVHPSGRLIPEDRYHVLMSQVEFELGAIASHCLSVYRQMGRKYYSGYRPVEMILKTDVFYNFVEEHYDTFRENDGVSLTQAYAMYKEYCNDALVEFKLPLYKFREELKNYFEAFDERVQINGERRRNYYTGFSLGKFLSSTKVQEGHAYWISLDNEKSVLDDILSDRPAQYANENETPQKRWSEVVTTLREINTTKTHYVRPPTNHIVIDFDLKGDDGQKSFELNLEAASRWPATYAETSKSGSGIHLHYTYDGDPELLSRVYAEGVEVKVFVGNASLRRKVFRCNNLDVATINSGLPLKETKSVINFDTVKSEKGLRALITRNLNKEVHPGTKPSVDFIKHILDQAYESGMSYDVSDMYNKVLVFANNSSHQAAYCVKLVGEMKFASEEVSQPSSDYDIDDLVFFDCEVFPNLFVICWKVRGAEHKVVRMINPTADDVERLIRMKLVGYNCRQYDNHIIYGALMGYNNQQLYALSQKLINGGDRRVGKFNEAYAISYADIYDFSSKKQSLKKFEIELGLNHLELGLPWDEPVPDDMVDKVAEYCENDVVAEEAVFEARYEDFVAREILSELSGLTVNDSTQQHTARIIFGKERKPQTSFVYTELSKTFPGYTHEFGKSSYRGEDPGEGGYVYAEPGMYTNVALLDVASMHPTSIEILNLFGPYTENFSQLLKARLAIKNREFEKARGMLGGILVKHLGDEARADALAYALKIVINIVYGLTSAKFPNMFRDERNVDNIVAKRGALFMIDLKHEVQARGFTVAHIKTDSIKIPDATPEIIEFVMEFGKKYGYTFEHEKSFSKLCLVNDAVYIGKISWGKHAGTWEAVGAQFQQPYVFKKLFAREPIEFDDLCEIKTVTTALHLNMNEGLDEDAYRFVGRAGRFCPIKPGCGGGLLMRAKDDKFNAATGTKGYRWLESETVALLGKEADIDLSYYDAMVDAAVSSISKFGDFEWFTAD